jgi:outer membrane protein assembly factor BamB
VLQYHNGPSRDGVYVDAALTKTAAATMHLDPTFAAAPLLGPTYASPLYLDGTSTKPDLVVVATFANHVYALDATNGQPVWDRLLAPPGTRPTTVCSPGPRGITGTPVIDGATRTIYVDAMTSVAADGGSVNKQMVFALDADTGNPRSGAWPVDVDASAHMGAVTFDSSTQNQRGALMLVGGTLFIAYGGFGGDCGVYHGWIVGISTADPAHVTAWATPADRGGGIWGPGGMSSDGTSIYFATGNGSSAAAGWQGTEAVIRLPVSLAFSQSTKDYFAPSTWQDLDATDGDLASTAPIVVNAPGMTPSELVVTFGKDDHGYLLDRTNLGGIGGSLSTAMIGRDAGIFNAPAAYTTPSGTYVTLTDRGWMCPNGTDGFVSTYKIAATSPPTLIGGWCNLLVATQTRTAATVSMTDAQGSNALVWVAASDNKLYALDGDTGAIILNGLMSTDMIPGVERFQAPIIRKGRIFIASDTRVYAYTTR